MAYKRNLYRPATSQTDSVSQKKNRKPLAQGRLVSGSRAETAKVRPVLASGIDISTTGDSASGDISVTSSRVDNGIPVHGQGARGDFIVTPRKMAPQVTEQRSPAQTRPVITLDLSDSDPDLSLQYKSPGVRVHTQMPQEVLVMDASRQTKNPNLSEVDILVGYEKSPIRVVCHSPMATEVSLRNSAKQGRVRKVDMDKVPTLSFQEDLKENEQVPVRLKSPVIIREKLSGAPKDPFSRVDNHTIVTQMERVMNKERPRMPQPNFDDSPESDKHCATATDDVQSMASDTDACSVNELVTKPTKKVKKSTESSKAAKTPVTAKKKKARVVQSRYMQSAQSKAKASLSAMLDQSSKNDSKTSKSSRSMEIHNRTAKQHRSKQTSSRINSAPEAVSEVSPRTPDVSQTSSTHKTSTPTMDDSLFHHEIDASAIHADISALSTVKKSKKTSDISRVQKGHRESRHVHLDVTDGMKSMSVSYAADNTKGENKVTQKHLNLLYNRYLQWLYLQSKAKRDQEEQEKQAMAQNYWLYQDVQRLRAKKHEAEKELARLKHFNDADEQIDLQRQALGPTANNLPVLTKDYETLAHALDTTRHQIQTKEVYLPDDQDQLQRQLEQALTESEYLLGELSVMIRQPASSVSSMSNALTALDQAVNIQSEELKQCSKMLAATQSLARQEQSLQVQMIQSYET